MKTKKELIQRQQAIVDAAKAENRDLTAEEKRDFEALQADIDAIDQQEAKERTLAEERARVTEITDMCRSFDINPDEYVKNGSTVEATRAAILDQLKVKKGPASVGVTADEADKFRSAAADALAMRSGTAIEKPAAGAEELRHMSLRDLACECLSREGHFSDSALRRMDKDTLFDHLSRQFFNPTSAFPAILDETIRKNIVQIYKAVPTTFQEWCTKGSVSDFKPTPDHNYIVGGGSFEQVGENGELKASKPGSHLLPNRKIDTYGTQFSMTRQAFINDDIGFLAHVPGVYAAAAKRKINQQVYGLIFHNNAAIYDGKVLFGADHGNVVTEGTAPTMAAINALMLKMQAQKDPFGEAIGIMPRMLVLPIGHGLNVDTILHSTSITTAESQNTGYNPMKGKGLTYVEDPTLNALAGTNAAPWFLVANPVTAKSVQVDYLNGQETPNIRRSEVPGTLGYVWDIYLDWGITVLDYRGIARNNGVAVTI